MEFELSKLSNLSSATKAFLDKDEQLLDLLDPQHPYFSIEKAIKGKSQFPAERRAILSAVLKQQYSKLKDDSEDYKKVSENIEILELSNTYTVCTGQQLHLFVGPAFVLYKILTVINMCENLRILYPDKHFVPVYWLASEDHDFDEIKNTKLFQKTFEWKTEQKGACGRFHVKDVSNIIESIKNEITLNESQLHILAKYSSIYNESETLSEATIRLIHLLFGSYGLVCINPDNKELKSGFSHVISNDIIHRKNADVFDSQSADLKKIGLSTQLKAREINFFYIKNQLRERVICENNLYRIQNTEIRFTEEEIKNEIANFPERFSPNAMLRPLYQEYSLPNICYVGGNAEVNYWLQISNVFNINDVRHPKLSLRHSMWIIPGKIHQWLQKRNINPHTLLTLQNEDNLLQLLNKIGMSIESKIFEFSALRKDIQDIVAQSSTKDLQSLIELGKTFEKMLKNTEKNIRENQIAKQEEAYYKLKDIFHNYLNVKQMQERVLHSLELLIKHDNVVFTLKSTASFEEAKGSIIDL